MKALSLWQPWATGIATGIKAIETRHWHTPWRGLLAIHAAKRWEADQREFAEAERRTGRLQFGLPFGGIVAVVHLGDIKRTEQLIDEISEVEEQWGNYAPRRYGWLFSDVRPLAEMVPCRGFQSLWDLDPATTDAVMAQLPASLTPPAP